MLPILRIVPVGGVCLAVLILLLAISPPRETREGAAPEMVLARGALIDRRQHPEWPQFLVRAAFRRAGEILTLRDLPDTPTRVAPVALPPERPAIAAPPQAPSAPDDAVVTAPQAVPAEPAERQAEQNAVPGAAAPSPASEGPVTQTAALTVDVDAMKAEPSAAPQTASAPAPADSAKPDSPVRAPATATKVAVLPIERPATDPDPDDVTGSVDTASGSTIPVDIGETSSTELPIVLPRERPPIVSTRGRSSRAVNHKRPLRHARATAKPGIKRAAASNVQPASEVNLFESLFGSAGTNASSASSRGKGGNGTKAASTVDVPRYPPTAFYPFSSK